MLCTSCSSKTSVHILGPPPWVSSAYHCELNPTPTLTLTLRIFLPLRTELQKVKAYVLKPGQYLSIGSPSLCAEFSVSGVYLRCVVGLSSTHDGDCHRGGSVRVSKPPQLSFEHLP